MLRKLEKYEVLDEIGHGGIATVYRARDSSLDRFVALKVLHPEMAGRSRAVRRLQREARTAGRLAHPNIVAAIDMGESG